MTVFDVIERTKMPKVHMKTNFIANARIVWRRRMALVALMSAVIVGLPVVAFAGKGDLEPVGGVHKTISIPLGKAELIKVPAAVGDVMVANSGIVDVTAVQADRLYAVGLKVGDTNLIILDPVGDEIARYDIHVKYDLVAIRNLVKEIYPEEDVKVGAIHDQLVLTGTASTPEIASRIANVVGHYVSDLQDKEKSADELVSNLLEVRGEQQVTLKVKVVEASRDVAKELGVKTNANDLDELSATNLFDSDPPGNLAPHSVGGTLRGGAGAALNGDPVGALSLLADTGLGGIGLLNVTLDALEDENLVNILAEPNLTAVSGEQAGFLAGGEYPVPVGRDQNGNITVEFKEFGVSLNFRPTVMSGDRIALQLDTEVSSLDFDNAVELSDLTVPGLDIRKASTSVEVASGGTLMIAGIIQSKSVKGMAGLPGIKNTPILGKLMSSDSFNREESELLVFVTPYLVKPFAQKNGTALESTPNVTASDVDVTGQKIKINDAEHKDIQKLSEVKSGSDERMAGIKPAAFGNQEVNVSSVEAVPAKPVEVSDISAPVNKNPSPLELAYALNVKRAYKVNNETILERGQPYGYILE